MILYADENFFLNNYCGGAASAALFQRFAPKATQIIKHYTGSNVDESNVPDCVKYCCCEIVQLLVDAHNRETAAGGVESEVVGDWEKTYESSDTRDARLNREIGKAVEMWLSGSGLLFRGVRS